MLRVLEQPSPSLSRLLPFLAGAYSFKSFGGRRREHHRLNKPDIEGVWHSIGRWNLHRAMCCKEGLYLLGRRVKSGCAAPFEHLFDAFVQGTAKPFARWPNLLVPAFTSWVVCRPHGPGAVAQAQQMRNSKQHHSESLEMATQRGAGLSSYVSPG